MLSLGGARQYRVYQAEDDQVVVEKVFRSFVSTSEEAEDDCHDSKDGENDADGHDDYCLPIHSLTVTHCCKDDCPEALKWYVQFCYGKGKEAMENLLQ